MKNFKSGNKSRGGGNFSRRSSGGRGFKKPELHDAVCDDCGKKCQVPFKPSGDKPIYCSDCFEKRGGKDAGRSRDRGDRRDFRKSSQTGSCDRSVLKLTEKIEILNTKLDKIISLLPAVSEKKSKPKRSKSKKVKKPKKK